MNAVVEIKPMGGALASHNQGRMAVSDIIQHVAVVQEVMRAVMKPDVHYGTIPGTPKPTLYKAGAEVLCMVFRVADTYEVTDLSTADTVRYRVNCIGAHQVSGVVLGSGLGEASSGEEKYKWRKAICKEEFDETPANMRRVKHARGKGGTTYKQDQIRTEPADLANTILKMANKRAKMAMVLNVTAASDCFSQDLEDMDAALVDHLTRHEGDAPTDVPAAKTAPTWPAEAFDKQTQRWTKAVAEGLKTTDEILAMARSKGELTPAQEERIKAMKKTEAEHATDDDLPWKD
ncbi:MAG: hypothetical protein PHD04_05040 [Candidatus Pacebacteria bacterium]|nr:hypothetical protein [Candidatus Paceibacterota bacterium]